MTRRHFAPKSFLRTVSNELLKEYFLRMNLLGEVDFDGLTETGIDPIFEAWWQLTEKTRAEIELDFQDINELGFEGGIKVILERARLEGVELSEPFAKTGGFLDQAFRTFLEYPDIFDCALTWLRVENMSGFRHLKNLPKVAPTTNDESILVLEKSLEAYYLKNEARGKHCKVEFYNRPGRYCYCAYPEDYATSDIGYNDEGKFEKRLRRVAFEIIFLFYPEEGRLSIKAPGKKELIQALQKIFAQCILKTEIFPDGRNDRIFELNGLKNRHFPFPTDPADGVEYVKVTKLRLSILGNGKQRILLEANDKYNHTLIYDLLDKTLNRERLPLEALKVTQAELKLKFPGKGNRGLATFNVSWPDSCNLKDSENHLKAKAYLQKWGIDRG